MARAQVSIEYLMVTGFSILLITPLLLLFASQNTQVTDTFIQTQARQSGQALADAAQRVYYAGPPSMETVNIRIPQNTESIEVTNKSLVFTISAPTRQDLLIPAQAKLIPTTIDSRAGPVQLEVLATDVGVRIREP